MSSDSLCHKGRGCRNLIEYAYHGGAYRKTNFVICTLYSLITTEQVRNCTRYEEDKRCVEELTETEDFARICGEAAAEEDFEEDKRRAGELMEAEDLALETALECAREERERREGKRYA